MNDFTPPTPAPTTTPDPLNWDGLQIINGRFNIDPTIGATYLYEVDPAQWDAIRSSARCYVIDIATTEKFPLSYSMDNGSGNFSFKGLLGRGGHEGDTYWYVV